MLSSLNVKHSCSTCTFLAYRFSSKPKKGIKFLQDKGLLSREPEEVAKFFHSDTRLNKTAVGDYMGEGDA